MSCDNGIVQGVERANRKLLNAEARVGHLVVPGRTFASLAGRRLGLILDSEFEDLFPSGKGRRSVPESVRASTTRCARSWKRPGSCGDVVNARWIPRSWPGRSQPRTPVTQLIAAIRPVGRVVPGAADGCGSAVPHPRHGGLAAPLELGLLIGVGVGVYAVLLRFNAPHLATAASGSSIRCRLSPFPASAPTNAKEGS